MRMRYITRSEVRKDAFINLGCSEIADQEGNLQLRNHTETEFITITNQ